MFNNVLKNPELAGFSLARVHVDKASNQRPVEYPNSWECVAWPQNPNDPDEVPASFHRDVGYGLAAGFMKWEGGYVQRGVQLRKGQRYLAKGTFFVNLSFTEGHIPEGWRSHIEWRFLFNDRGYQIESPWMGASQPQFGMQEETLFVVEPLADITIDIGLVFRSRYPSTAGEILVKRIELLEAPQDYGTPVKIGNPNAAPATEAATPTATTSAPPTLARVAPVASPVADIEITDLSAVMTSDDIVVIAAGFRAAAVSGQFSATIADGFARFADVLERMKSPIG